MFITEPIKTGKFVELSIIAYIKGLSSFTTFSAMIAELLTISTSVTAPAFVKSYLLGVIKDFPKDKK